MAILRTSRFHWLLVTAAALLLAGCATGGPYGGGGYGGGYGGGHGDSRPPGDYGAQTLYGTVRQMDPYRNRIILSPDRSGGHIELLYDRGTDLYYRGRRLAVEGLEPGDGIRVAATRAGGRWWARSIEVTYNVREGYGGHRDSHDDRYRGRYPDRYDYGQLHGEVLYVDPRAQVIGVGRGYGRHGDHERIRYDYRTVVEYRGRRYRPADLERGDIVHIDLQRRGNGWIAGHIQVERDISW